MSIRGKVRRWLVERFPYDSIVAYFRNKDVPEHAKWGWYLPGGLILFLISIQIISGILLAANYAAEPEAAHESVARIINEIPYGWLIHSIHGWGANLIIAVSLVHMFSVYMLKSYRRPRELMWVSGVTLMLILLGFAFTGTLLPWDTKAYFATLIGTEVPKTLPIVGTVGVGLLKGAEEIGRETLSRMFTLHVIVLPLTLLFVVSFHLLLNQLHGVSVPPGVRDSGRRIPFFPNFFLRDLITWFAAFGFLVAIAALLPKELGEKANALASAPAGIKPEWYFLPLFQTLRMAPADVAGVSGELLVNASVGLLIALWLAVPFVDRQASRESRSPLFTAIGVLLIVYLLVTLGLAYLTE